MLNEKQKDFLKDYDYDINSKNGKALPLDYTTANYLQNKPSYDNHIGLLTPTKNNWVVWHGLGGSCKTSLLREFTLHATNAKDFLETSVPHHAMVVSFITENAEEFVKGSTKLNQVYFQSDKHPFSYLDIIYPNLFDLHGQFLYTKRDGDGDSDSEKIKHLKNVFTRHFRAFTKIFIDHLAKITEDQVQPSEMILAIDNLINYYPYEINDAFVISFSQAVNEFCKKMEELTNLKTSVITIHHTAGYKDKSVGSAHIARLASYSMLLEKETSQDNTSVITLSFENNKFSNAQAPIIKSPRFRAYGNTKTLIMDNSAFAKNTGKIATTPVRLQSVPEDYENTSPSHSFWSRYLMKVEQNFPKMRSGDLKLHLEYCFKEALFHKSHMDRDDWKFAEASKELYYSRSVVKKRMERIMRENNLVLNPNHFDSAWQFIFKSEKSAHLVDEFAEIMASNLEKAILIKLSGKHPALLRVINNRKKSSNENG